MRKRIILENDDKVYSASDVLPICKHLNIPMVLDIHHHWCNNTGDQIENLLPDIFSTWDDQVIPPKIHLSSPKSEKNNRAHADYVDPNFFYDFLKKAKEINRDFDVMIEAKCKDKALIELMTQLEAFKEIKILDGASFEL